MNEYRCKTRLCKGEPMIKLLDEWLCESCWIEHCNGPKPKPKGEFQANLFEVKYE